MYNWIRRKLAQVSIFTLIVSLGIFLSALELKIFLLSAFGMGSVALEIIMIVLGGEYIFNKTKTLSPYFQEKYQILRFANKETRKTYEKIIFKYDSLYKKMEEKDKQNFIKKMNCLLEPALMEAKKNKETKEKIILEKQIEKQKTKLEIFEQWYQEDKIALHHTSKKDQ